MMWTWRPTEGAPWWNAWIAVSAARWPGFGSPLHNQGWATLTAYALVCWSATLEELTGIKGQTSKAPHEWRLSSLSRTQAVCLMEGETGVWKGPPPSYRAQRL